MDAGSKKELPHRECSAADVTAHKIRVHLFKQYGRKSTPRHHAITKSRCEALDLRFDARCHIEVRPIGNVTIRPEHVFAGRGPRRVIEGGLRNQHERLLGTPSICHRSFRCCDLFERAAKVQTDRAGALRRLPRNRLRKSVIDLECARALFELLERAPVSSLQTFACQCDQMARRGIAQGERVFGVQLAQCVSVNAARRVDNAAQSFKVRNQCLRNGAGPAAGESANRLHERQRPGLIRRLRSAAGRKRGMNAPPARQTALACARC